MPIRKTSKRTILSLLTGMIDKENNILNSIISPSYYNSIVVLDGNILELIYYHNVNKLVNIKKLFAQYIDNHDNTNSY